MDSRRVRPGTSRAATHREGRPRHRTHHRARFAKDDPGARFNDGWCRFRTTNDGERPMGMVSEFKEFAMRGNVVDLAVGLVIGAAFGKIVSALVDGIVMPLVGMIAGGIDFGDLAVVLEPAT